MRAFHNDCAVKARYIARLRAHREAEHLRKGVGWETDGETTRGCAIGCTLEAYDHDRYPIELGLPVWLARLEDAIFEGLPAAAAQAWPERFLGAIPVGAEIGQAMADEIAVLRLRRLLPLAPAWGSSGPAVVAVVEGVIRVLTSESAAARSAMTAARAVVASAKAVVVAATSARARVAESAWSAAVAAGAAVQEAMWAAEAGYPTWSAAVAAGEPARALSAAARAAAQQAAWSAWTAEADCLLAALGKARDE